MGADEPDVDHAVGIVDPDHNAILVAGNVEDRAAIPENASTTYIAFDAPASSSLPASLAETRPSPAHEHQQRPSFD